MKEKKTLPLFLLISLIVLLFAGMLILCGLYIDLRVNGVSSSLPEIPENDKWILTDSGYNAHNSVQKLISFSFIGFNTPDTGKTAAAFTRNSRKSLVDIFEKYAVPLFSGTFEKVNFDGDTEKNEFVRQILSADEFMFAGLYDDIPSAAIIPGLYGGTASKGNFDVRYIFILPDETSVTGICFDSALNAVVLHTDREIYFDRNEFLSYNGVSGFAAFDFSGEINPEPVFTQAFDIESVMIVPSFSFYNFENEGANAKQLLKVLGFNTSLVKKYTSADNREISFVDEGAELNISLDDETIYYNGYDAGIHLSEFLKYYPQSDEYSFSDTVLGVKYLINSIDRLLVGGEALPSVVGVCSENGKTSFKLKYFYNGILLTDNPYDISVTVDGEYITAIEIHAVFCDSGNLTKPSVAQKIALSVLDDDFVSQSAGCNAMFKRNSDNGSCELVWVVRRAEK